MDRTHYQGWHSYLAVNEVERHHFPFYALVVAAMKHADDDNLRSLKIAFPGLFEESQERYNNRMGMTNAELENDGEKITSERYAEILKQIEEEFK